MTDEVYGSMRLRAHQARKNGDTNASVGLAQALARNGVTKARSTPTAAIAHTSSPQKQAKSERASLDSQIAALANAVANNPACKGKASVAVDLLSDAVSAKLPGDALVMMMELTPARADAFVELKAAALLKTFADPVLANLPAATKAKMADMMTEAAKAQIKASAIRAAAQAKRPSSRTVTQAPVASSKGQAPNHGWAAIHSEILERTGRI